MLGVERERLRRLTLPTLSRAAFDELVAELLAAGRIAASRAWLHLPEHEASLAAGDRELFAVLKLLLDVQPFGPPRVRDVAKASGTAEDVVRQLFRRVARAGELYPVAHDHYFTADAVAQLAAMVAELNAEKGAARAADLRDRIGGGRKVAIHILEFFDRIGYTRRVRDEHLLRGSGSGPCMVRPIKRSTEKNVPRWGARSSKPGGVAMRSLVGSTPALFRQFALENHLGSQFHHAIGRQAEETGRAAGVAEHADEELLAPEAHCRMQLRDQGFPPEEE
jgi:hypothetical protein